jgi:hypothetical protein
MSKVVGSGLIARPKLILTSVGPFAQQDLIVLGPITQINPATLDLVTQQDSIALGRSVSFKISE